jgi:tetratricopeptide (TPR) repeat protein
MIVKNEANIIGRLLRSVLPLIDCYCICDTGSNDNTKEFITTFFDSHNIPGKIVEEPFINFAHNRNFALNACENMSDYILLLDADMELKLNPEFKKSSLTLDHYHILQGSSNFIYKNVRIIKNNGKHSYIGVTHEYLNSEEGTGELIKKEMCFINDIGDGNNKSNKFERDIQLLTKGIEDEPNNKTRYTFYLANSYFDSGLYEKAIEQYKIRITIGGWNQETWYSYYKMGLAYKKINNIEKAIYTWLDAYNFLPTRIENLYEIILHYRNTGKNKLAYRIYEMAKDVIRNLNPDDKTNFLFLHNDIYTYQLDYEFIILAYYMGLTNIEQSTVNLFNNCSENSKVKSTLSNLKFYKKSLKKEKDFDFTSTLTYQSKYVSTLDTYYSSSISIIPYQEGYLMNVRYVNYYIAQENGEYILCNNSIYTINKRIQVNKHFEVMNESLIIFDEPETRPNSRLLQLGVEDMRLFEDKSSKIVYFTGCKLNPNSPSSIVYGEYPLPIKDTNEPLIKDKHLNLSISIPNQVHSTCEKNWVFVDYNNETHMIYKWYPLQICKIDLSNLSNILDQELTIFEEKPMPLIFSHTRGSTNGFKYNHEIWFVIHIVSYESPRHYYHIICVFDDDLNLLRYSAPFKFQDKPIEYCLGLIVEDTQLIITYSEFDKSSHVSIYNKEYIESLLLFD